MHNFVIHLAFFCAITAIKTCTVSIQGWVYDRITRIGFRSLKITRRRRFHILLHDLQLDGTLNISFLVSSPAHKKYLAVDRGLPSKCGRIDFNNSRIIKCLEWWLLHRFFPALLWHFPYLFYILLSPAFVIILNNFIVFQRRNAGDSHIIAKPHFIKNKFIRITVRQWTDENPREYSAS